MKSIRIIVAIFIFANLCYSQTGWYQVNSGTTRNLRTACFVNLNTGFAAGEKGTLLKTVTTGSSWTTINLNDSNFYILKIHFKDQNTGFIIGFNSSYNPQNFSKLYKTTNGGINWNIEPLQIDSALLINIEFPSSTIGYISGGLYKNKLLKTINGGISWEEIITNIESNATSQRFINESIGFIGAGGKIYKTIDGGINWNQVYENLNSQFVNSIKFINSNTGFACGGNGFSLNQRFGYIIKTTNAGNTWNYLYRDTINGSIIDILVYNEGILYGCGGTVQNGFVVKTYNGGINWINELNTSFNPLFNMTNSNTKGLVVGYNGTIFKKDNIVSVTQISTTIPLSINLYQNYPNPFNPETTIKFDLIKTGFVTLKIYDISGKEVQNLFNGVKEAGSYQLKFDGASLNSGVYFYKLMTNGTTITKSMVLVK